MKMMNNTLVLSVVVTALIASVTESFVLQPPINEPNSAVSRRQAVTLVVRPLQQPLQQPLSQHLTSILRMTDGEEKVETEAAAAAAEDTQEEEETEEEEPEEPEEDPEIVALKEEIKTLESTLKSKRQQVQTMQDRAEHYSQAGYARKVAEMENMRRDRSQLQSSNTADATALTLAEFLPVLDRLTELKQQYETHDFGKSYNALSDTLRAVFTDLGVTEYTVATGDLVDKSRMLVVDTEHSEEHSADTVLRPVGMGMELQGYIVRYAECVASLGPENPPEEEGEGDAEEEEDAPAAEEEA